MMAETSSGMAWEQAYDTILLLSLFIFYLCFLSRESKRIEAQRLFLKQVRKRIATELNLEHILHWENGWENTAGVKLLAIMFVFTLLLNGIVHAAEGNLGLATAIQITPNLLMHAFCLFADGSKRAHVFCGRFTLVHQATWFGVFGVNPGEMAMRREVLIRIMGVLVFFESVEEGFAYLVMFSIVLDMLFRDSQVASEQELITMPLKLFFTCVLPLHVLGLFDCITSSLRGRNFSMKMAKGFLKGLSFVSCLVPTWIVSTAYVGYILPESYLVCCALCAVAWLALAHTTLGPRLDRWLSPNTLLFRGTIARKAEEEVSRELLFVLPQVHLHLPLFWLGCHAMLALVGLPSLALVCLTAVLIGKLNENRVYSQIQADVFLHTSVALCLGAFGAAGESGGSAFQSRVLYSGIISSLCCLLVVCAKEVLFSNMAAEVEKDQFIAHAIKQKFAGVGGAIEHVLLQQQNMEEDGRGRNALLFQAMMECRMGHDRCHACNVFRKLDHGIKRGASKRALGELHEQLLRTTTARVFIRADCVFAPSATSILEMDWEVLHLVLTELSKLGLHLIAAEVNVVARVASSLEMDSASPAVAVLTLDRPVRAKRSNLLRRLILEVGGELEDNRLVLHVDKSLPPASRYSSPSLSTSTLPISISTIADASTASAGAIAAATSTTTDGEVSASTQVSKLRFAIVDDNALIRKNFTRVLVNALGVPEHNILAVGATLQECLAFPQMIVERKVDVAVFDQNLDFDDDVLLKGSDLAKRAKQEYGFKGCLVLHTSDSNIGNVGTDVFHGSVEKSANSSKFVGELLHVLHSRDGGATVD